MKVRSGTSTTSPRLTPTASIARWTAAVPLFTATAYELPIADGGRALRRGARARRWQERAHPAFLQFGADDGRAPLRVRVRRPARAGAAAGRPPPRIRLP